MPKHIKFLAYHAALGFAFAIFLVLTLLVFNVANLRELLLHSNMKWTALFILTFFMGLTFASVQMGIAIMRIGKDDDDDDQGRGPKVPLADRFLATQLLNRPRPIRIKTNED